MFPLCVYNIQHTGNRKSTSFLKYHNNDHDSYSIHQLDLMVDQIHQVHTSNHNQQILNNQESTTSCNNRFDNKAAASLMKTKKSVEEQ